MIIADSSEIQVLELCTDCVVCAHGSMSDHEYDELEIKPLSKFEGLNATVSLREDEEGNSDPFFSYGGCDGCETTLGGSRYECNVLV